MSRPIGLKSRTVAYKVIKVVVSPFHDSITFTN